MSGGIGARWSGASKTTVEPSASSAYLGGKLRRLVEPSTGARARTAPLPRSFT